VAVPTFVFLMLTLTSSAVAAAGQAAQPAAPQRAVVVQAARELMTKARYCALVTLGDDGHLQARVVDAFAPDADMTVWIGTNPVTRKVREITKDPRVTLYYFDQAGPGYVTLLGNAQVVDDAAQKSAHWKEDWAGFYSDKNRGSDYVLIRVRPSRLEIVSYSHKLLNDPKTWRPITVDFQKEGALTAHATGTFEVKLTPQGTGESVDGTALARMSIDKTFRGDLEGTSKGEMLTAGTAVKDSAGYVAIERVSGTLDGRKGTFILQHTGTMTRGAPQLTITVVPDSGTGELTGLSGRMAITIADGKHSYEFEYTLTEKR